MWREFRRIVDDVAGDRDPVTIAEVSSEHLPTWAAYYGRQLDGVHMPFGFHLLHVDWSAAAIRSIVERVEAALPPGAWPNWVLGNHDQPRVASRAGAARARVAMLLLLTLRGAPTLYYGDELGMLDGTIPPERVQDPWERRVPGLGRDRARTPMRWEAGAGGGFCPPGVEPWLPMDDGLSGLDVASQRADPRSMLNLTREILQLRRSHEALASGAYRSLPAPDGCYAYERFTGRESMVIALDLAGTGATLVLPRGGRIVLATHRDRAGEPVVDRLELAPFEGAVVG